jgi:wyosine [tRNA(Phe)-imidazoG37] synthetase (radical SAM superfamily)
MMSIMPHTLYYKYFYNMVNAKNETKLFNSIIFGPIISRRLGVSLGINLLPVDSKICNFDCIYCECGWTDLRSVPKVKFHPRSEVYFGLEKSLIHLLKKNKKLDSITFAGNGEPTMHPEFNLIIDDTIELRDKYFPSCKISVLSNSLMLSNKKVFDALIKIDNPILKLDAGTEKTFQLIDQPINKRTLQWVVNQLMKFNGRLIIQTIFLRGEFGGEHLDNTTDDEVRSWLKLIKMIKPEQVMIYTIDRATPAQNLEKIEKEKLREIAARVELLSISTLIG